MKSVNNMEITNVGHLNSAELPTLLFQNRSSSKALSDLILATTGRWDVNRTHSLSGWLAGE